MGNTPSSSAAAAAAAAAAGVSCSASTIVAEVAAASHELKVEGYSATKGLRVGESIASSPFTAGGYSWRVRYFPAGMRSNGWICVDLALDASHAHDEVRARFKLSLLDIAGDPVPAHSDATYCDTRAFNNDGSWCVQRLIKRKDLEASPHLVDDSFRIRCDVMVVDPMIRTESAAVAAAAEAEPPVAVPPPELHRHLAALLAGAVGGDVRLEVWGETFTAHRSVLAARSPVFMAELFGAMRETTATHVRIDDVEPRVFKALLHFIYTDLLPETETETEEGDRDEVAMAQHLVVAADRYGMERLKLICEAKLHESISTSTAAGTLLLAEQHGCRRLKEACLKFIAAPSNLKVVMASDDFEHLLRCCPSLPKDLAANLAA
ncbi:hypothetical protein ACP4OV_001922 [Aristida adscensionis]